MPTKNDPIGIYNSGVGGLSVLREVRKQLPGESLIYFGDQAKVPYGSRPIGELQQLAEGVTRFLLEKHCKLVVIACNTASAASLKHLRELYPDLPIVGMEPAVKPAAEQTSSGKVGVLATPSTFAGALYASVVERFAHDVEVFQDTCPGLVAQIEKGYLETPKTRRILEDAILPMLDAGVDTLVMGCTHYPFVIPLIEQIAAGRARVIDPAPAIARQVRRVLEQHNLINPAGRPGRMTFYTSGDIGKFSKRTQQLMGIDIDPDRAHLGGHNADNETNLKGNIMIIPAIINRRSIRKFQPKPVEAEKITAVLEAARWAPSGNNMQPARYVVVRDQETRFALCQADHNQAWMMAAPVFIVVVADLLARVAPESTFWVDENSPEWEVKRVIRDTAVATGYLLLEAENQGLGTCWTGFFSQEDVRPILGLPEDKFVVAIIPVGYPAESPNPRTRKSLDEIVRHEKWS